jgi:hypothetical protein
MTYVHTRTVSPETLFGEIIIPVRTFRCHGCGTTFRPDDAALGVSEAGDFTDDVRSLYAPVAAELPHRVANDNKATCLSLLSNAVLMWNTVHMTRLIAQLRATVETIADEDMARISPAAFAHVIPNGTYFVRPTPLERDENSEESLGLLDEGMESEA